VDLVAKFQRIHSQIRSNLADAQATYKKHYNAYIKPSPGFRPGDLVWLSHWSITTIRPSQKLDFRRLGPFKILECVGKSKVAYKLDLPATMRIHPVFHKSLLSLYHISVIPGHTRLPPPAIKVKGQHEYDVKDILDSKIVRNKLRYFVSWASYAPSNHT
jgi:hypothetical protein